MVKIKIRGKKDKQIKEMDKHGNENPNERKARLFPGYNGLRKIAAGIAEEQEDYSNCKTKELDKKYKLDKDSGLQSVELDKKLDCDYIQPQPKIVSPDEAMRWQKLANIQKEYEGYPNKVSIAKPVFDDFMNWLDSKEEAEGELQSK
jgi:hypothetical protein